MTFNETTEIKSDLKFIHRLVEQAVDKYSDRTAVVSESLSVTYKQLNQRADNLCQAILHTATDAPIIGVCTTRCVEMVISVLAILKAGKAYLPIDPEYPELRLQQILTETELTVCMTTAQDADTFKKLGLSVILAENQYTFPETLPVTQGAQACVLYTSGSTGKPKGVCLSHAGLVNLIRWQLVHSVAKPGMNSLQFSHLNFDASFPEIFVPLASGGTVYLIDEASRLDAVHLLSFLEEHTINRIFLPYVALQYLAEAADAEKRYPNQLLEVATGGEQIKITPQIARFFEALPNCTFMNAYGPTEASVWITEKKLKGEASNWPYLPPVGTAIGGTEVFILDERLQLVADEQVGELCIGGVCLATGYLKQPALTAEKFIGWKHPQRGNVRVYRTGDLARRLPNGEFEFCGRRDDQIKIRGNRVELAEIEIVLMQQPSIQQAVVVAREDTPGQKMLAAYLVARNGAIDITALRKAIAQQLPDYMIPAYFTVLEDLPKNISGKVDRKALPKPNFTRPELAMLYRKPSSATEQAIAGIWSELLHIDRIGLDDNFFELGGNSLLAQKTVAALKNQLGFVLPITKLYQYPSIAGITSYLNPDRKHTRPQTESVGQKSKDADVAVIGMAGRFPGASTVEALWEMLREGREAIRFFSDGEVDPSVPDWEKNDPQYVKARGILDQADQFDPAFFGINPKLAELMDPQQRIFLEIAWEVLEQTGYLSSQLPGSVGVYAGCGTNTYYLNNVRNHPERINQVGGIQVTTANEKDYIASRVAYHLDLKGPSVSVYAASATSLLAIAQAVAAIRNGECELALAGGVSVTAPQMSGHVYQEGAMFSPDGHCRPFDAQAQGTVFSDGAGVVLLKNLEAAQRDGDTIYAVVKGIGVTNDGGGKGSFTAPSAEGQARAIRRSLDDAQIDPATIGYVEAHGTATPLGDPIEIEGLTLAFGNQPKSQYCAIGSLKSNMGHLTAAAGVAGFIKATLAVHHRQIPASLHFESPNPAIDLAASPFFVNTTLTEWPSDQRRAGISSFGAGGTNIHIVIEGVNNAIPASEVSRPLQLITWSAKSIASRDAYAGLLADQLSRQEDQSLADVAFTLQTTRPALHHRRFVVAASASELIEHLRNESTPANREMQGAHSLAERPDEVVFMFPGQGAQYLNMGRNLYENEPVYRQAIDECATLLTAYLDTDIREVLFPEQRSLTAEERLKNTRYTQPALFVTEYAMAKLWMNWGIEPTVFCGHSIGEFVAAHLAGVFTLADALKLVTIRGRLVSELPRGSMLSVRMRAEEVYSIMPEPLSLAAINSSKLCVVAGHDEDIAAFARVLDEQNIPNQVLVTSHAFHSAMMDPILAGFEKTVQSVTLSRPVKPIVSSVSGAWLTDTEALSSQYWAMHLRVTVRFADALDFVMSQTAPLLLEVGPGSVTTTLARQQAGTRPIPILTSMANANDSRSEYAVLMKALGQLWLQGIEPDWQAVYANERRVRVKLPTYAFDRQRYWVDPKTDNRPLSNPALINELPIQPISDRHPQLMRKEALLVKVKEILENASGIEMETVSEEMSFLEIGLDSLLLTQVAQTLKKEFSLPLTFRQLNEDIKTLDRLATYLDEHLPAEKITVITPPAPPVQAPVFTVPAHSPGATSDAHPGSDTALSLIAQQLALLAKQVALLEGNRPAPATAQPLPTSVSQPAQPKKAGEPEISSEEAVELRKPFGATARIERHSTDLTTDQQLFLRQLTQRYNQKTRNSKAYTQQHRSHMADPRVVTGFKPVTKELVYPIVVNRSKGSRLWDIDGNEYIDTLNGFGSNMFGHQPDFIQEALHRQIDAGYEVGPQHELAGEVCELIQEFTGFDRIALCNTGSEAVLGAMRIARTITDRSLIVAFSGSYHGIVDEVIVRGTKKRKTVPAAPGIMPEVVQNMLILDYGTEETLQIIKERASELAAVLVEPVQSRRPEFRPISFLQELRTVTAEAGTALVFDEVITGFRMHPGGAQALFGIKADLATYGKVVGGGMPIGVIAGRKGFMDALDGGYWQYGDASTPEVGVTYFAGTFVRHPLALAAAKASLIHMKKQGPVLQQRLTSLTERLAKTINAEMTRRQIPLAVVQFGSLWKLKYTEEIPYGEILFTLLREKGIHIYDGFPCFVTETYTDAEIDRIISLLIASTDELIQGGFLAHRPGAEIGTKTASYSQPPVPGARLGRDKQGNPGWFVVNPDQPGQYLQVDL